MKVSEKSLELNIGEEILWRLRNDWGMQKAYLRGLTQAEERREGVDFFAQLSATARIFAFQFKAPQGGVEAEPYRYKLVRYQHNSLQRLSKRMPQSVFYVLPFYISVKKLQKDVPLLSQDTWLLDLAHMDTNSVFALAKTRTIKCWKGRAKVNPEYSLQSLRELALSRDVGVPARTFAEWYSDFRRLLPEEADAPSSRGRWRRNPWLARGLRVAVVP